MKKQTVNFGTAIEALKQGLRVAREGWNGKGMYLFMQVGNTVSKDFIPNFKSLPDSVKEHLQTLEKDVVFNPSITMFTAAQEMQPGWLASQSDIISEDWIILDKGFVSQHEKDMVSFGEYLLSDERRKSFEAAYNSEDNISLEERLAGVYHADFENWKAKQN